MNILLIGGNRFVGYLLTWKLLAGGHHVTLFNRGSLPDPFGDRVERIRGDRTAPDFHTHFENRTFDGVVDCAAFTGVDVQSAIKTFSGKIGHYFYISSGQVYLVRQNCPKPSQESDYHGPLLAEPPKGTLDHSEWLYGIGKRDGEDALIRAFETSAFPSTRLRIPMVNGERDYYRRFESYLWRMVDGGPVLVPTPNAICRHVYGMDVVDTILRLLGNKNTFGKAWNFAQDEEPTLMELLQMVAGMLGSRAALLPIDPQKLAARNLTPKDISPCSITWMSHIDPAKAKADLNFRHTPLRQYLQTVITSFLANPPADKPKNYANRGVELELAKIAQIAKSAG